jgi:superfamily II DNA or RNA helicase
MSVYVKKSDIPPEKLKELIAKCFLYIDNKAIDLYQQTIQETHAIVPFNIYYTILGSRPNKTSVFPAIKTNFTGALQDHQVNLKTEAIKRLNEQGSAFLKLHCGAGKTCISIYIATKIKLKTLIVVHRVVLMKQWADSIAAFTDCKSKVVVIKANDPIPTDSEFYIINVVNVFKRSNVDFMQFGFVVFDECHIMGSPKAMFAFRSFSPKFMLGLSATPYREDGMHAVTERYLGDAYIEKQMKHPHIVYKVNYKPHINYGTDEFITSLGKLNWTKIINHQAMDDVRNELIIRIVTDHPTRTFLVLCKRVEQCHFICESLKRLNASCDVFTGNSKTLDYTARVLVSTYNKSGVGFDHPHLDALIIATDVKAMIEQYHGRIFRRKDCKPILFDIVDDFGPFHVHYAMRRKYYIQTGAVIRRYTTDAEDEHVTDSSNAARVLDDHPDFPSDADECDDECDDDEDDEPLTVATSLLGVDVESLEDDDST